jgi:hypothetical protein
MECTWDPRPTHAGGAPVVGVPGVRDPVIWTGEELRVLTEGCVNMCVCVCVCVCVLGV